MSDEDLRNWTGPPKETREDGKLIDADYQEQFATLFSVMLEHELQAVVCYRLGWSEKLRDLNLKICKEAGDLRKFTWDERSERIHAALDAAGCPRLAETQK